LRTNLPWTARSTSWPNPGTPAIIKVARIAISKIVRDGFAPDSRFLPEAFHFEFNSHLLKL
jgi:hypothetical protein